MNGALRQLRKLRAELQGGSAAQLIMLDAFVALMKARGDVNALTADERGAIQKACEMVAEGRGTNLAKSIAALAKSRPALAQSRGAP